VNRAWTIAGIGGGAAAAFGLVASASVTAAAGPADHRDPAVLLPKLVEGRGWVLVFQVAMTVASLAVLVFAAGLHRHLAAQEPAGSLTPAVAAGGLGLAAALSLVGAGIGTELWWTLGDPGGASPYSAASMVDIVATMSWVWAGAGLSAAAVAVAALRRGSMPRWTGWASAVAAVLVLGVSVLPVQYLSGMLGAVWLIVVAVGLAVEQPASDAAGGAAA